MAHPDFVKWFDRDFPHELPEWMLAGTLERLRGTPARLEERLDGVPEPARTQRVDDSWSMQEHAGHLLDLEPLWAGRVEDFLSAEETLRPADLENTKTHQAKHNEAMLGAILESFRAARLALVRRIEGLHRHELARTALHPRLRKPMKIVDLAYFVAEHDDHHLTAIGRLLLL